jgi:pimeloyl-ACP methyl ester carboxylesterase
VSIFGAGVAQQVLALGRLDEIIVQIVRIALGDGVRLFGEAPAPQVRLERTYAGTSGTLTKIRFRVAGAADLRGVDAWRVYLGLPLSGTRLPAGGLEAFFALGFEDAVLKLYWPTLRQAVDEFPQALAELRTRYGLAEGPIAVVGASIGTLVALSVLAARELRVDAIALVSPALRLASLVEANERRFSVSYPWSTDSRAIAAELDFVARAPEIVRKRAPMLLVVGADDDAEGIARPAEVASALVADGVEAAVVRIPQMGHALADEPGLEPAPQSAAAVAVAVVAWLRQHLP